MREVIEEAVLIGHTPAGTFMQIELSGRLSQFKWQKVGA